MVGLQPPATRDSGTARERYLSQDGVPEEEGDGAAVTEGVAEGLAEGVISA